MVQSYIKIAPDPLDSKMFNKNNTNDYLFFNIFPSIDSR